MTTVIIATLLILAAWRCYHAATWDANLYERAIDADLAGYPDRISARAENREQGLAGKQISTPHSRRHDARR